MNGNPDNVNVAHPYHIDARGHTATTDDASHVRQMIEQVLFTSPGERVNRPTFGSGLLQLVFAPNSEQLASALQLLVQGALQQWLSDVIVVEAVSVGADDSTLTVSVRYSPRTGGQSRVAQFTRSVSGAQPAAGA